MCSPSPFPSGFLLPFPCPFDFVLKLIGIAEEFSFVMCVGLSVGAGDRCRENKCVAVCISFGFLQRKYVNVFVFHDVDDLVKFAVIGALWFFRKALYV